MRISDWSSDVCSSDLVNSSRSAYIMGSDGKRVRMRTAINDTRGHIAELLAKALSQGSLDQALTAADKEKLLPFLKAYGDLGADRSEERRVGKAGVSTFRYRWAPYHSKKTKNNS